MTNPKKYSQVLSFAVLLALIVIVLGAYTRLTDSGLGCPDWPGCYGQLSVPEEISTDEYQRPLEIHKAWNEMIHRYVAGSLGFVVLLILYMTTKGKKVLKQSLGLPLVLLGIELLSLGESIYKLGKLLFVVLFVQVSLGIMNVVFGLPIAVATLHTLFAALLLMMTLSITHRVYKS